LYQIFELAESLKNQGLAKNFANPLQIGAPRYSENTIKLSININFFIEHSEEILEMKEQIKFIKNMIELHINLTNI